MDEARPVRLLLADDLRRSRLTVFFRLLLAIPHFFWLVFWTLAVFVVAVVGWFAALALGRVPGDLHGFMARWVRYVSHLYGYVYLAANPYPGFLADSGYPVDVEVPGPVRQRRLTIAFRLFLALPALIVLAAFGSGGGSAGGGQTTMGLSFTGIAALAAFLGWFAALALGRMPGGLRDLGAYTVGYGAQVYSYLLLLTPRYPNSNPDELGPRWQLPPHPVTLHLADDGRRSRLTVFFRLLLTLPHLVWVSLWTPFAFLAGLLNWLLTLVLGRSVVPLHRFLAAYIRYGAHLNAFLFLVANPFPGFTGTRAYPVDLELPPPGRQSRWVTLFRWLLMLPALLLAFGFGGVVWVVGFLGWFASLATGRMPTGLRNLGAIAIRYSAQTYAYGAVLTDRYPYSSPAVASAPEPEPEPEPEPPAEPGELVVH